MAFMNTVRVIESKNPAVVLIKQVWKQKREIVANHFSLRVYPDFFAQEANAASAPNAPVS